MQPGLDATELKYLFSAANKALVLDWVDHSCVPDPRFPAGVVSSLYLDTLTLDHYREKQDGDFLKSKVRLRWYAAAGEGRDAAGAECFLEVKRKQGAFRSKTRLPLRLAEVLDQGLLTGPGAGLLESGLHELGYRQSAPLVPLILISYTRRRYLDPATGKRLAVDTDIHVPWANTDFLTGHVPALIGSSVLETKQHGGERVLSPILAPIRSVLVKTAFSKYAHCVRALSQQDWGG